METFFDAYVTCALWSTCGEDDRPLDDDFGPEDIAPETLAKMREDCEAFTAAHPEADSPQGGHDFWLTRNHHGAGFWDGDWPDDGKALTEASHAFGSFGLYVGDDGRIYGN